MVIHNNGVPSGLADLDKLIECFGNSQLITLASKSAMGKTTLALNFAVKIADQGMPVAFISMEMTTAQLMHRVMSSLSRIESTDIKYGSFSKDDKERLVSCIENYKFKNLIIGNPKSLTINGLRSTLINLKKNKNIKFAIIDYLQLLQGTSSFQAKANRQNEVAEISRILKETAVELNIPILVLAQLSRKVEERTDHKPVLSDLRESGAIEQDSDVVLLLTRRDYYDPVDKQNQAQLIIAKNRHGETGTVNMSYDKKISLFGDFVQVQHMEETW